MAAAVSSESDIELERLTLIRTLALEISVCESLDAAKQLVYDARDAFVACAKRVREDPKETEKSDSEPTETDADAPTRHVKKRKLHRTQPLKRAGRQTPAMLHSSMDLSFPFEGKTMEMKLSVYDPLDDEKRLYYLYSDLESVSASSANKRRVRLAELSDGTERVRITVASEHSTQARQCVALSRKGLEKWLAQEPFGPAALGCIEGRSKERDSE